MNQRPFSPSIYSEESAPSSPESREHLSLTVPPPVPAVEHSRFSPITPSEHASPLGQQVFRRSFPRSRRPDPEKGPTSHSNSSSQSLQPGIRNSLARLSAILRVSRRGDSSVQRFTPNEVASPSEMSAWRLDHARESDSHHALYVYPRPTRTQERYTPALLFAFTIFLLYLFINVVVLNARSFSSSHSSPRLLPTTPTANASTSAPASAPTTTMMVSADTQQCLTQFTLNATNDPKGYPCSTCLPLLLALPTNASSLYPVAWDATQFCGLRSIWEDASQQGRTGLEAGGWVNDVQFCTWSGVRCNNAGRVSSLYVLVIISIFSHRLQSCFSSPRILTSPAIPASLPAQFTSLTELETMEVVGNGSTPGMILRDL